MTAQQASVGTAPGVGSALEILRLGTTDIWVPSTVIRALDDSGDLASLRRESDGGLRVHVSNPSEVGGALPIARDVFDRMRVTVESVPTTNVQPVAAPALMDNGAYPAWYARGSQMTLDQREQQQMASQQAFAITRQRWIIT